MKKYQLWLQRKSYSQHLFNLMKIKLSNHMSSDKLQAPYPTRTPSRDQSMLSRYKQLQDFHNEAGKLGDISYAITYKQLKNRKLRLMKSFQILNQNMSMARRIKEVKSVLSSTCKDKTVSQHSNKRKLFEKKCELSNQEIREQNFKKFSKWQSNKLGNLHRYHLALVIETLSKFMHSHDQYAAAWCQISTEKGFVRSELVGLAELQGHRFNFSVDCELPKDCLFRLYVCKGLNSQFVGQFQFRRPQIGQLTTANYRSDDCQFQVRLGLAYQKGKKQKFMFNMK